MGDDKFVEALGGLPTKVEIRYATCEMQPDPPASEAGVVMGFDLEPPTKAIVVLSFSEPGFGFGEVALVQTPKGLFLDTEHMSLERVKKYFVSLLDSAITDIEKDPVKHALYNQEAGRQCGPGCGVCFPDTVTT